MYTVVKQKVNSTDLRTRLGLEPDLIQARIMKGNILMWVGEVVIENEKRLDRIVKKELAKLVWQ
jgi:hypothetical protein